MQRRLFALALVTLPLFVPSLATIAFADCNDPFGKPGELLDFHVKMSSADWKALLENTVRNVDGATMVNSPACTDKFKEFKAEFRCGDKEPWIKIGIRKKKGTERGIESPNKPPLKLDFNEDFPDENAQPEAKGQRWPAALAEKGFRKLTLNNGQGNKAPPVDMLPPFMLPVLLSEHSALRLLNIEIPSSPQTALTRVFMHLDGDEKGKFHGVYLIAEDLDKGAIEKRFGKVKGRLIKASTPDCSPELQFDDLVKDGMRLAENEATKKFEEWVTKDATQYQGKWLEESKNGVDLDVLLRQEAIREILVNGNDTILNSRAWLEWEKWGEGNNWFAFDPEKGVRQYMPWDVDLTFGNQRGACTTPTPSAVSNPPAMVTNMDGTMSLAPVTTNRFMCPYDLPILDWCRELPKIIGPKSYSRIGKQVCAPEVQKRYLQVMCQLTNGPLSADEILKVWDQADATAWKAVMDEKDVNWEGRNPLDEGILKSYGAEYRRLRKWIPQRIKSVQEQITAAGVECKPGCPEGEKDVCSYNGGEGERVCKNKLWSACRKVGGDAAGSAGSKEEAGGCNFGGRPSGSSTLLLASVLALAGFVARRRSPKA